MQQAIDILDEMIQNEVDWPQWTLSAFDILHTAKRRIQALWDWWIKIDPKDRETEPEPDTDILVSYIWFNNIRWVREANPDCQRDWKTIDYLDWRLRPIENVTHWMPLPLPPNK